ncbi:helix-turn-helix domain-containing protein [Parabacteroides distasonis]|uniref:Helix-turn-helix domain-containing protein n=1 Tax=Parabacteroides distasonis TaxID=823 RepID=A0A7L5EF91_PARDI|nr:helix-turn-helix domain-containing protein [Parabacteroides distasonis]QJE30028.1 helix-turn-helix domain-containing protein [Parabacteroides distasonis]WRY45223.1 helix-turn-helix domain-containing protein [Parabacteroides distasonis]
MEVVVIEKATFERMLSGFEDFAKKVERLCRVHEDLGEREWLDSDNVCRLLGISPRTLQTMRENGTLAYSKINHKVYYRPEDVKAVFPVVGMKRRITANKGRELNTDTGNQ